MLELGLGLVNMQHNNSFSVKTKTGIILHNTATISPAEAVP